MMIVRHNQDLYSKGKYHDQSIRVIKYELNIFKKKLNLFLYVLFIYMKAGVQMRQFDFCFQPRWSKGDRIYSSIKMVTRPGKTLKHGFFKISHSR